MEELILEDYIDKLTKDIARSEEQVIFYAGKLANLNCEKYRIEKDIAEANSDLKREMGILKVLRSCLSQAKHED